MRSKALFTKEDMQEKAEVLWERYGERYRNLIPEYQKLLARKRELGLKPLNAIKAETLKEVPEIEFLSIRSKKEAKRFIKKMIYSELSMAILKTELMVDGYAFRTIEAHIWDFRYEIQHRDDRKKSLLGAYDSDYAAVGTYVL